MIAEAPRHRRNAEATVGVLLVVFALFACSSVRTGPSGNPYKDQVKHNSTAREELAFGMSRAEAAAVMGTPQIIPPWANARKIGLQIVANPLDTLEIESPSGDLYQVDRYAVGLYGEYRCPFIRGEAELEPLIFFEGKLVGWRWSYLASALQRRLTVDEQRWSFGEFCGAEASTTAP
jgi:hypothetical protein